MTLFAVAIDLYLDFYHSEWNFDKDYWIGFYYILLQFGYIEMNLILYSFISSEDNKPRRVFFAALSYIFMAILSGYLFLDIHSSNLTSHIYKTNNIFTSTQCDNIIHIAEQHAHNRLNSLLLMNEDPKESNLFNYMIHSELKQNRDKLTNSKGWLSDRNNYSYQTTDISVDSINATFKYAYYNTTTKKYKSENFNIWINKIINKKVLPILKKQYNLPNTVYTSDTLKLKNLYIVKYNSNNEFLQNSMKLHTDASEISFNIALSSQFNNKNYYDIVYNKEIIRLQKFRNKYIKKYGNDTNYADKYIRTTQYLGGGTYFERANQTMYLQKGAMLSHPSKLYHSGEAITEGKRGRELLNPYSICCDYN